MMRLIVALCYLYGGMATGLAAMFVANAPSWATVLMLVVSVVAAPLSHLFLRKIDA